MTQFTLIGPGSETGYIAGAATSNRITMLFAPREKAGQ
jgi:hypothetical protein